jgi:hypothetical protein
LTASEDVLVPKTSVVKLDRELSIADAVSRRLVVTGGGEVIFDSLAALEAANRTPHEYNRLNKNKLAKLIMNCVITEE